MGWLRGKETISNQGYFWINLFLTVLEINFSSTSKPLNSEWLGDSNDWGQQAPYWVLSVILGLAIQSHLRHQLYFLQVYIHKIMLSHNFHHSIVTQLLWKGKLSAILFIKMQSPLNILIFWCNNCTSKDPFFSTLILMKNVQWKTTGTEWKLEEWKNKLWHIQYDGELCSYVKSAIVACTYEAHSTYGISFLPISTVNLYNHYMRNVLFNKPFYRTL